jgi:hypothetical protein
MAIINSPDAPIDPFSVGGTELVERINRLVAAFQSNNANAARPPAIQAGGLWSRSDEVMLFDGAADASLFKVGRPPPLAMESILPVFSETDSYPPMSVVYNPTNRRVEQNSKAVSPGPYNAGIWAALPSFRDGFLRSGWPSYPNPSGAGNITVADLPLSQVKVMGPRYQPEVGTVESGRVRAIFVTGYPAQPAIWVHILGHVVANFNAAPLLTDRLIVHLKPTIVGSFDTGPLRRVMVESDGTGYLFNGFGSYASGQDGGLGIPLVRPGNLPRSTQKLSVSFQFSGKAYQS